MIDDGMMARANAADALGVVIGRHADLLAIAEAHGQYTFECRGPDGVLKWEDVSDNVVCTEGKNLAFTTFITAASYAVVGPYMGLISSVSWVQVNAADTGVQINGTNQWKEAGGANAPTYSGNRPTTNGNWAAASGGAIAFAAPIVYTMTGVGTLEGAFLLYGSAAIVTKDDAHGILWSAGTFTGGTKLVGIGDTVSVSYSTSM